MRIGSLALLLSFALLPLQAEAQLLRLLDRTAPDVEIVAPASGAFVSDSATIEVKASDGLGTGVASVAYQVDGTAGTWTDLSLDLVTFRWKGTWDSTAVASGSRVIYVRATDLAGNERIALVAVVVSNPPPAPIGLQVSAAPAPSDGGALDLRWSPGAATGVAGYHVYASNTFSGSFGRVATVTGTTWRDAPVPNGSTQYYQVSAFDGAGNESPRSATASGTAFDTRAPQISGVVVGNVDADTVRITWQTHEPATSQIEYGTTPELETSARTFAFVTDHAIELDGLLENTTYHFVVRAQDVEANASQTQPATFTTRANQAPSVAILAPADGSVITGPARLIASATDDAAVAHVEWSVGGIEWSPMPFNGITGQYEVDLAGWPDGTYAVGVRAWDDQGAAAIDSITVTIDRQAPVVELLEPAEEAHMAGAAAHPIRVQAIDDSIVSVEWQILFVDPALDIEAAPEPDPLAWTALPFDPMTGYYEVQWMAPTVVIENVGYVYVRVTDGAGRVVSLNRETTVMANGVEFSFVGTSGQTITGGTAVEAIAADGGNRIGIEFRCRDCTPGGDYTVTVSGNGGSHQAALRADGRGRGDAFIEADTSLTNVDSVTITPAGPGF